MNNSERIRARQERFGTYTPIYNIYDDYQERYLQGLKTGEVPRGISFEAYLMMIVLQKFENFDIASAEDEHYDDEEEYEGDSRPDPTITKEQLDRELDEYFRDDPRKRK